MLLRDRFRAWRRERPFWGAALIIAAGLEMFVSGRLDLAVGGMVLQLGFAGLQTTVIPLVLALAGVMALLQPVHRVFYGVIALVLSVYAVVAVNAGGLVVGTVLGVVGGIVVVSWMGAKEPVASDGGAHRSTAVALSLALAAAPLAAGPVATEGPCWLGFLFCDLPGTSTPSPSPSSSPTDAGSPTAVATPPAESAPSPSPSPSASEAGEPTEGASEPAGSATPAPAEEPPSDDGLTVEMPQGVPLPAEEQIPVVLGGTEEVTVYALPAELKASDMEITGLRTVALVSVPVNGDSGERRNAIKIVADHVKVSGFELKTYAGADQRAAGTYTSASSVTMDGSATMYLASLTAAGPDGEALSLDAEAPPETVTAALLALVDPTIGLLGATSDQQVWSGFHESVWEG